jgi:putative ABC transport system permease protein
MLKINLKLALRNILRNKLYTAINIIGLGVASAFCILVYLYVKNERSFDSFHNNNASLFRVEESNIFGGMGRDEQKKSFFSFLTADADKQNMIQTPVPFGIDLKKNFPEVEDAVRIKTDYNPIVRIGNQSFKEKDNTVAYVDPNFFRVFNYPLLEGNKASVLSSINQVVLSQRMAKKYFGNADPIGKTINITSDKLMLTVSGVAKDFPQNSSFQYDILIPIQADSYYVKGMAQGTNSFSHLLIIKLAHGTNEADFQRKLDAFSKPYFKTLVESMAKADPKNKPQPFQVYLRPFAQAHYNQSDGWDHYTDLKNIYQLICLTVVILLIACLNYILLTLTSAISRSQDVGVRKTIGANRKQIVFQYYVETQLLAFIAVIAGFFIAVLCVPFFNGLIGSDLSINNFTAADIGSMIALALALGLLAGVYPALAMSGLKPLNIMRSFSAYRISPGLSKSLVVLQYTICIVLVISALVINKQMRFLNNADMGFDKNEVVVLQNPYSWDDKQERSSLKTRLTQFVADQPYLQDITSTYFNFGGYNTNGFMLDGKHIDVHDMNVDFNYFTFNKISIVKGRNFSTAFSGDSAKIKLTPQQITAHSSAADHNIVVNETLYDLLGKPKLDVVNRELGGVIVGVCKDYNIDDLTKKIEPTYHEIQGNPAGYFWIKIKPGQNIPQAMDKLQAGWNKLTGNLPFSYSFMDQDVAKSYDAYKRWMSTITTSCILAILIACLGLFGLSGLTTLNRTKEIGIRKVLGASVSNLFILLNRGTLYLAAGSFVIAAPIAFYLVHQWLDNFAYRIKPDWLLFTAAGAIAMLTAVIAVSYHTIKAAVANPVNSLRNE